MNDLKCCNTCNTLKPLSSFSKDKKSLDGHTYMCKVCKAKSDKEYRRLNKHRLRQQQIAHYTEHKSHYKDYYATRYQEKKSDIQAKQKVYYELNKEVINLKSKDYYLKNKSKYLAWSKKSKLRRIERTPNWLTKEDYQVIESFYSLAQKLTIDSGVIYHVDHIIPLKGEKVSGLHVPSNLQVITATENLAKSNKFKI
jgi:hypothetical protein